ncbi:MAG: DUF433 domain-containing protein [Holophagales bacterium]|nr:MAG: DUF433 domain-containing protein [Holophagales bacterium]
MNWMELIEIGQGLARIRGCGLPVSVVLDNLAAGVPVEALLRSYPDLSRTAVLAALAYAADLARRDRRERLGLVAPVPTETAEPPAGDPPADLAGVH